MVVETVETERTEETAEINDDVAIAIALENCRKEADRKAAEAAEAAEALKLKLTAQTQKVTRLTS